MTTAVVLIEAERDALQTLGGQLADLDGVAEAYSVTGEWDFVAIIRVPRHEMLADVVTGELVEAARGEPDADDGGVRGLLPPRPGGDVLDRGVDGGSGGAAPSLIARGAGMGGAMRGAPGLVPGRAGAAAVGGGERSLPVGPRVSGRRSAP